MWGALCLLWVVGQAATPPAPRAAAGFTISGTVIEHGSNRPLKDAIVSVTPVQQADGSLSFRTGEDGHFVFADLAAGKYRLNAEKRGFPEQAFQQYEGFSTAIAVGSGLQSEDIVFPLFAGGSITGTVLDEENEPIRFAQVLLFNKQSDAGSERVGMRNIRQTNSLGQFRFANLRAGTYYVAVQARPWYAQNNPARQLQPAGSEQGNERELDVVYPLTYSGGVTDSTSASPVTVAEGGTSDLPFVLRAIPALHIQVTGLPPTKQGVGMGINVMEIGVGGFQAGFSGAQVMGGNGNWEIGGIGPGRYLVSPFVAEKGAPEQLGSGVFDFTADGSIDLSSFNRTSLAGRMTFEGNTSHPQNPIVVLYQAGSSIRSLFVVAADGTLKLAQGSYLLAGRYELRLQNAPGFYLKTIEAKGATVTGRQVDIPESGAVELALVASTGVTSIDGIALKDDKGVGGAMVLLIPKEAGRTGLIRRDQSDSDGTFTLADVAPGKYTLVAINDGRDLAYEDPTAMKPYLSQGTDLTVPLTHNAALKVEVLQRLRAEQ